MSDTISCEDFKLTASIKQRVDDSIDFIKDHLGANCNISVFLKRASDHSYKVIFRTRLKNKEILGMNTNTDLYAAIIQAKSNVARHIDTYKKKKLNRRKRFRPNFSENIE